MPKIRRRRGSKRKNDESNTTFGAVFLAVIIGVGGLVVWTMFREDAKPIEIRNAIDEKYSTDEYPPPTPTPLPPS